MITLNQKVNSEKKGTGVVAQIITKSTGYVLVNWDNGTSSKEMAFNLTDDQGNALGKKKSNVIEVKETNPVQRWKKYLQEGTNRWHNQSSYFICEGALNDLKFPSDFILSLCRQWFEGRCSEKQAYYLALEIVKQRGE